MTTTLDRFNWTDDIRFQFIKRLSAPPKTKRSHYFFFFWGGGKLKISRIDKDHNSSYSSSTLGIFFFSFRVRSFVRVTRRTFAEQIVMTPFFSPSSNSGGGEKRKIELTRSYLPTLIRFGKGNRGGKQGKGAEKT